MTDPFVEAATALTGRRADQRWRQVALLGIPAASGDAAARARLAAALVALDHPVAAGRIAAAGADEPWARWWSVIAVGQLGDAEALDAALAAARTATGGGPDSREVARRLADLDEEIAAIRSGGGERARFALLGHRARPERRVAIGGRSSATFLVEPSWDAVRLVRLAPSEGPAQGNLAAHSLQEVIALVRQGQSGAGREVAPDVAVAPEPALMLEALREDAAARDRRLIALAEEVRDERERLAGERARLEGEWAEVRAERARLRRTRAAAPPRAAPRAATAQVPRTPEEACALLGLAQAPSPADVERCYRDLIVRCHPDRVAELHPSIRARAEELTVALNAARDLLLQPAQRRRRAS